MNLYKTIKENLTVVTLTVSIITACLYMVIFHVYPWESMLEIHARKQAVANHLKLGQKLLDYGYYSQAVQEFEQCLKFESSNPRALVGKRKAYLFLELQKIDCNPGVALAYRDFFKKQGDDDYNLTLLTGKVHLKVGEEDQALELFQKARELYKANLISDQKEPDYYDALSSIGWYHYDKGQFSEMEECFRQMKGITERDYRGFYGLGYALYMKAYQLAKSKKPEAREHLEQAVENLANALNYVPQVAGVNADLGDVLRILNNKVAIDLHKQALSIYEDNELYNLEDNKNTYYTFHLIGSDGTNVSLKERQDKIACAKYQLALDYYASAKKENPRTPDLTKHDDLVKEGDKIRKTEGPKLIYKDQRIIVDTLLSAIMSSTSRP